MKTQLWQLLRCCSGSLGCHYSKESSGTEKFVSVAKSCFPSQKGRWVQEPRNGSRNVHTYHHSQDSQGPFGLLCPPSAICSGVSIPSAQRRHTFTMGHRLWGTLAFLRPKVTCWQDTCLENPMDRGAWKAPVQGSQRVSHDWSNLAHRQTSF